MTTSKLFIRMQAIAKDTGRQLVFGPVHFYNYAWPLGVARRLQRVNFEVIIKLLVDADESGPDPYQNKPLSVPA